MEEALLGIVTTINNYLSNYILIILLLGMGIWFTVRTKAIQFRCFGEGWRRVFGNFSLRGGNQGGGMTSFQALSTAIAAQVGTGNIVGACGAIIVGGPGAIFWMWIIALLGMATNYAEAVMAQKTRVVDEDGTVHQSITSPRPSRATGASSSPGSSPWPSFWRSASWAAWCKATPSPRP